MCLLERNLETVESPKLILAMLETAILQPTVYLTVSDIQCTQVMKLSEWSIISCVQDES